VTGRVPARSGGDEAWPSRHDEQVSRFLILGCGHTGTTLISGILHINGYGSSKVSRLFEDEVLNDLNERILVGAEVGEREIEDFLATLEKKTQGRWCLKDPRLSETVEQFYRHLHEPVKVIFNFRHPGTTVRSLIKEREMHERWLTSEQMLKSSEDEWMTRNLAAMRFLERENRSPFLMVDYDDLVDRKIDATLCRFVGQPLDLSFITPSKRRSTPVPVRRELLDLYEELIRLREVNNREALRTTKNVPVKETRRPTARTRMHVQRNRLLRRDLFRRLWVRASRIPGWLQTVFSDSGKVRG
jgi:hypothetical protein